MSVAVEALAACGGHGDLLGPGQAGGWQPGRLLDVAIKGR